MKKYNRKIYLLQPLVILGDKTEMYYIPKHKITEDIKIKKNGNK